MMHGHRAGRHDWIAARAHVGYWPWVGCEVHDEPNTKIEATEEKICKLLIMMLEMR